MPATARHLSTFYLGYFGLIGLILPYLSLYFLDLGFSPYQIGILMAINPLVKVITPSLWGWLADHRGTRRTLMRLACTGALVSFAAMPAVRDFMVVALVLAVYAAFTSAILPLVEATAMEAVERLKVEYGRIRLWGSVGFIVASLGFGPVLDIAPTSAVLWAVLLLLAFNAWSIWQLPESRQPPHAPHGEGVLTVFTRPRIVAFYLVCMLMQMSHGAFYGFFSIYLEGEGFSRGAIGFLWALGVAAEVMAMHRSGPLLEKLGTRRLMRISLGFTVLRWGMLSGPAVMAVLVPAQLLHAASFALFHVAAVTHTHRTIPERFRATGQSLYSSLSFGLGLTVAMYLCGLYYEQAGAPALYIASAGIAALALGLAFLLGKPDTP